MQSSAKFIVGCLAACAAFLGTPRLSAQESSPDSGIWRGHESGISGLAVSQDGDRLATSGLDGTVRLWDTASGRVVSVLRSRDAELYAVAFSWDGKSVLSTGDKGVVTIFDARTGKMRRELGGLKGWSADLAISPDGRLAAAGLDKTVKVWDVPASRELYTLKPEGFVHPSLKGPVIEPIRVPLLAVSFSPDGKALATAGADRLVRLWEAETGRFIRSLQGHTMTITALAFAPDGKTLFSAGLDKTVRLWRIE
jgi:WD40 repeat protein